MSGFAGIVGAPPAEAREWVEQAAVFMAFRGPDGQSVWRDDGAALGHALLATAPEERGSSQPQSLDGVTWLTGDIRLDRRDEVARSLRAGGRDPSPGCTDAELLLNAWHLWGEGCLERISGDFAFAIWDTAARRLVAARDQFGVAQFYYAILDGALLFSNTLEALLLHPRVSTELDERAIGDYLLFGMNAEASTTSFQAIRRLPPAHSFRWQSGNLEIRRYWSLSETSAAPRFRRAEEYVERFLALFTEAVGDRMRSDRVSLQVSGGLDSTSVAVVAHEVAAGLPQPPGLHALTVVYDGLLAEGEAEPARSVTRAIGVEPEIISAADYPFLDVSNSAEYALAEPGGYALTALNFDVARRASRQARVALTGIGGDPLLQFDPGYWMNWLARGQVGRLAHAVWEHVRLLHRPPRTYFRMALVQRRRKLSAEPLPEWLEPSFVSGAGLAERNRSFQARSWREADARGMTTSPFWGALFGWADPGFSRLPVRFRHPFFDVQLLEYVSTLTPLPWLPRKQLLRDAMRGKLPEPVRQRRKTMLPENPDQALTQRRGLPPGIAALLSASPGLARFVSRDGLLRCLDATVGMRAPTYRVSLRGLALAHWLGHWRRPSPPKSAVPPTYASGPAQPSGTAA